MTLRIDPKKSSFSRKAGDSTALSYVAEAIERDSPSAIETESKRMMQRYESDILFFKKKLKKIDEKRSSLSPGTATLRDIDRREELWDYFQVMKTRFEHHIEWLKEQVVAYRADIVLLEREKSGKR